jgi:hypothetical protein
MHRRVISWWFHFKKSYPDRIKWLIAGILGLSFLSWFITTQSPEQGSVIVTGITVITLTAGSIIQFLFNNVRRTGLLCIGVAIYLILRVLKLSDPLYNILLLLFLISLELSMRNR